MNAAQSQVRSFVRSRQMGIRGGREAKERCYKEASLAFFHFREKRAVAGWRRDGADALLLLLLLLLPPPAPVPASPQAPVVMEKTGVFPDKPTTWKRGTWLGFEPNSTEMDN